MMNPLRSLTHSLIYSKLAHQAPAMLCSYTGVLLANEMSKVVSRNFQTKPMEGLKTGFRPQSQRKCVYMLPGKSNMLASRNIFQTERGMGF